MKKKITYLIVIAFSLSLLSLNVERVNASAITESTIFNLTNNERAKYNVAQVAWNYKLASAARAKAQDMINRDYFSHNTPDGRTPWTFILNAGYNYTYAGENLAMNFTSSEETMNAWMNSGGHRANILGSKFRELGVGVVSGEYQGYNTIMVVQMFGTEVTQAYTKNESSKTPVRRSPTGGQASVPAPVIPDYSSTIRVSLDLVKKRVDDFKKASESLLLLASKEAP